MNSKSYTGKDIRNGIRGHSHHSVVYKSDEQRTEISKDNSSKPKYKLVPTGSADATNGRAYIVVLASDKYRLGDTIRTKTHDYTIF